MTKGSPRAPNTLAPATFMIIIMMTMMTDNNDNNFNILFSSV
jgi:hypothetical protein